MKRHIPGYTVEPPLGRDTYIHSRQHTVHWGVLLSGTGLLLLVLGVWTLAIKGFSCWLAH